MLRTSLLLFLVFSACGESHADVHGDASTADANTRDGESITADSSTSCPTCASYDLRMEWVGGKSPVRLSYELDCDTFVEFTCEGRGETCTQGCEFVLPSCQPESQLDLERINAAIAHPDVQNALEETRIFYGEDSTPVDGAYLVIFFFAEDGSAIAEIAIGGECDNETSCNCSYENCEALIPEAISNLRALLLNFVNNTGCG